MANRRNLLIAMFQGGGNIPQLLPIVARLVALGHQVRVLVGPGVRHSRLPVSGQLLKALYATGARVLRLREPDVHPLDATAHCHGAICGWTPNVFRTVEREACIQRWLPHWANEVAAELRRDSTDVLVSDYVLVGALVAAEAAGILGIKVRDPLLEIRRVALTFNDAPVEFRRSLVNTEHYEYFSDLAKSGSA